MPHYHFIGRVHPERAWLTVSERLSVTHQIKGWNATESGEIKASIQIDHAQLHVVIEEPPAWVVPNDDDATLKTLAEQIAREAVDAACFTHASGFDVEIVCGWKEGKMAKTYGIEIREVFALAAQSPVKFQMLFDECVRTPALARALGDFREAIRSPSDTAFCCERALESLARYFSDEAQANKADWCRMGTVLQTEKSVKDEISKHANEPRHGGAEPVSPADRVRWLVMTFQVIERFVIYRRAGDNPLDVVSWPLLQASDP